MCTHKEETKLNPILINSWCLYKQHDHEVYLIELYTVTTEYNSHLMQAN